MASNTKSSEKVQHNVDGNILAEYTIHKRIGKGAYGIVYKASEKKNRHHVAIKKIFDAFRNKTDAQRTYREILFLKSFQRHPNIITMLDIFKAVNNKDLYVIFEYMENDLNKVIRDKLLKDVHIRYIMFQLCNGLSYIHGCKVMHRDLKPSNILIDKSCSIKIADLGLARSLSDSKECLTEYIATRWYRAPEILISNRQYTHHVDIWSLGCILAEMLQSKPLFPGASTSHQLQLVVNVIKPKPPHADKFYSSFKNKPEDAIDLLEHVLVLNPENRPEAQQILEHCYVRKYFPSATHTIPQISPHSVVLDIDDNNQLEINDYQERLYDIVKRCKRKKSMGKYSKCLVADTQIGLPKAKDVPSNKYSSEKENEPNRNNVAPLHREKANCYMVETVQVVSNKTTEDLPTEPSDHVNKKDYISYNKHNIVNLTHDKTKPKKQHAYAAVSNMNNQDTPVLVTSKTYHIDKKHVSKTWLHPSIYDSNKPCMKENNKHDNISNKNSSAELTYQPKQKIKRGKNEFTTDCTYWSDTRSPIPVINCESVESKRIIQNTPYIIERKNLQNDLKPNYSVHEIKRSKDDHLVENRSHPSLSHCSSQPPNGQIFTVQTGPGLEANRINTEISVKIPQALPSTNIDMKIVPNAQNNSILANRKQNFVTCPPNTNRYLDPNIMAIPEKETKLQLDLLKRRQSHTGYNFYLTSNEVNCNVPENKMCHSRSNVGGSANKSKTTWKTSDLKNRLVKKAHAITNQVHTVINGENKPPVKKMTCETLEKKALLPNPIIQSNSRSNKIEDGDCKYMHHLNNTCHRPAYVCTATRYPIKQLGSDSNFDMYERRHSDNIVQLSNNTLHYNSQRTLNNTVQYNSQRTLNTNVEYNGQRTLCNGDNHTRRAVPQYPHDHCNGSILDQRQQNPVFNHFSNNGFQSKNYVSNKSCQTNKRSIDFNLFDSKQNPDEGNWDADKYNDLERNNCDTKYLGERSNVNIFQSLKKSNCSAKKQFEKLEKQFSEKLNNMHKLSVLNFNIAPISMDDSDLNEDLEASNRVRLLKPDLNEYISVSEQQRNWVYCRYK